MTISDTPAHRPPPMHAVVSDRPKHFTVASVLVPKPGHDQVWLQILAAGVCGTDARLHVGEFGPPIP